MRHSLILVTLLFSIGGFVLGAEKPESRLSNLKEKFPKIVFAKHADIGGMHYAFTEGLSDAQADRYYTPGSALCLLELGDDGEYHERTLLSDPNGVIRDPDVSFDGKKIVFAWKKSDREDDYHLYDYDVATGDVRQLTFGLGYADYEPCVLPDGSIVFNSSRCVQIVDCWWTEVSNLYTCDADGKYLRRLSFDQVHTNYPTLLDDGRIIYTRWDYHDRGHLFPQPLFVMNSDGTFQTEMYGNNSWFPTTILHARGIPGTGKMVAIFTGHHTMQRGKLGIIDPSKGRQENAGAQLIAPIRETVAERIDAYGQEGEQFAHPYPINEREFLVSFRPSPEGPFGIYWFDIDGNRELIVLDRTISSSQPIPLVPRMPVPERSSTVDWAADSGTYTLQDVYVGPGLEGIERGKAKKLRVIALDFRSVGIGTNYNGGPSGGAWVCTPIAIGNGAWDVKIPLGDAEIYADGSASFNVPARTPLYFQVLDENGHCIQTMRSWSTLQPGENFACIGCHEDKNSTTQIPKTTLAMIRGPQDLKPFYGPPRGFSFPKEIQPIFDKHCIECHQNDAVKPDFKRAANFDTTEKPFSLKGDAVHDARAKRYWNASYLNLIDLECVDGEVTNPLFKAEYEKTAMFGKQNRIVNWINVQEGPTMLPPYKAGAAKSELLTMLDPNLTPNTHNDVKLSREELDKLAFWIDMLIPYGGDYFEANAWNDADFKKYEYHEKKRRDMQELDKMSIMQLLNAK